MALLEGAWRAVPAVEELPIDEMWVGFRPGSRDDAPMLGPGPLDGLFYATGHHRNGILLTPVTADAMARLILDNVADGDPAVRSRTFSAGAGGGVGERMTQRKSASTARANRSPRQKRSQRCSPKKPSTPGSAASRSRSTAPSCRARRGRRRRSIPATASKSCARGKAVRSKQMSDPLSSPAAHSTRGCFWAPPAIPIASHARLHSAAAPRWSRSRSAASASQATPRAWSICSAARPLAAQHGRLPDRERRGADRRAGARSARDQLGEARGDRRSRDALSRCRGTGARDADWCGRASSCCPIATRIR